MDQLERKQLTETLTDVTAKHVTITGVLQASTSARSRHSPRQAVPNRNQEIGTP